MKNPFDDESYMTYVMRRVDSMPFNPKQTLMDGTEVQIVSASIYNEIELNRRITHVLKELLWRDEVTTEMLNQIGFSRQDAQVIGIQIDGLENINPPVGWEDA